ncbi:MAG TPA: hypothetical protein VGC17_01290 [Lactovum miscens]|uniref:hypothetical protein n=1 Tax=Lactovum miscens TaxID=190387 RepID=UPI002EDB1AEF
MARHKITHPSYKYQLFSLIKIKYYWGECLGLVVDSKFQYSKFDTILYFYISDKAFTAIYYWNKIKHPMFLMAGS